VRLLRRRFRYDNEKELICIKTANYNIEIDPAVKSRAEETFAEFGLNLNEAINVFLRMSIKWQGFPFEIREPKPNDDMLAAIQETEKIINEYDKGLRIPKSFLNAKEMFEVMDIEDKMEEIDE
jgi:DNA-damage-inducible protein J